MKLIVTLFFFGLTSATLGLDCRDTEDYWTCRAIITGICSNTNRYELCRAIIKNKSCSSLGSDYWDCRSIKNGRCFNADNKNLCEVVSKEIIGEY